MEPQTDLPDLVEDLEVNIDELTETLAPLLNTQLSTTASSLPLLDKAKLYVLAAYSIESLLYSTLQASGINAKEHAIFKELARLKGYFGKIKQAEERVNAGPPKTKLDVGAAARFIKHGLAGNDKYDLERAERMAKEKARAQLKARQINKKFDDNGEEAAAGKKREIEDVEAAVADQEEDGEDAATKAQPSSKKLKVASEDAMDVDSAPSPAQSHASSKKSKKKGKRGSKATKSADPSDNDETSPSQPQGPSQEDAAVAARPKRKQRGKKGKKDAAADAEMEDAGEEASTPARTTRKRAAAASTDALIETEGVQEAVAEKPKRGRGRPKKSK